MPINYVVGDATQPIGEGIKIITHICNNIGKWGKGFVVAISKRWQMPEQEYRKWFASGNKFQLGEVQLVEVQPDTIVANIIGQHHIYPQNNVPPIRYEAVREGLRKVAEYAIAR